MTATPINPATASDLLEKAYRYFPGGALGTFLPPKDLDFVVARGEAGYVFDAAGRRYIDYVLASGPMILGHGHPSIVQAVTEQVGQGTSYYGLNAPAIELGEEIVNAVPSAEKIRLVGSGAEATFYALRLARAHTGRNKILKFEGAYHGHHDYVMFGAYKSSDTYPVGLPDSAGIPPELQSEVLVAPFNDTDKTVEIIEQHRDSLAAVIIEPLMRVVSPKPEFLTALREATARVGAVLVFDEVVTGFRLAYGGAQEKYDIMPDLTCLGKILGGGLPLAAICGKGEIMEHANARQKDATYTYVSGTLNGNPLSSAAGLATLRTLKQPGVYDRLEAIGERARSGLREIVERRGIPAQVVGEGPLYNLVLTGQDIVDHRSIESADRQLTTKLGHELMERGIYINLIAKGYMSLVHTDADVDQTLQVFDDSLAAVS
ncbi:MAG: aminotransferase class III-fold pyridoxal phosphate-dependent enzyme [Chloroflexota bacterium]